MLYIPTCQDIANLQVGDKVTDAYGNLNRIVKISDRGINKDGKAYIEYFTYFNRNTTVMMALKEGNKYAIHTN